MNEAVDTATVMALSGNFWSQLQISEMLDSDFIKSRTAASLSLGHLVGGRSLRWYHWSVAMSTNSSSHHIYNINSNYRHFGMRKTASGSELYWVRALAALCSRISRLFCLASSIRDDGVIFTVGEEVVNIADVLPNFLVGSGCGLADQPLELQEGHFNRVTVRAGWRQSEEPRADIAYGFCRARAFMLDKLSTMITSPGCKRGTSCVST